MAQVVECLCSKCEVLSSNASAKKKKLKEWVKDIGDMKRLNKC
jgi:hypothetical protein